MTKAQFHKKYRALVRQETKWMLRFGEAALNSGAFDLKAAPDDYTLPKDVFCAGCERLAGPAGHGSPHRSHKRRVANIRQCVPWTI